MLHSRKICGSLCAAFIATILPYAALAQKDTAQRCNVAEVTSAADGSRHVHLADVWSGTHVGFDALEHDHKVFFGYYDAERWLTIAQYDKASGELCQIRLPSRFAGWDSHNAVALTLDDDNRLHVTANMHASPLIYAHTNAQDSIEGLQLQPLVGRDESHVTYTTFLQGPAHTLLLAYRSGRSGDGTWILDRFADGHWSRQANALFVDHDDKSSVSAYPRFNLAKDGTLQAAVVWRRSKDAADNFAVTYAETSDTKTWKSHDGKTLSLPMTPTDGVVETVGESHGLLNSVRVTKDADDQPIVTYTRNDEKNLNGIFAARPGSRDWNISKLAEAKQKTDISGGGSIGTVPGFNDLHIDPQTGRATMEVRFPGESQQEMTIDTHDLSVKSTGPARQQEDQSKAKTRNASLADLRRNDLQDRVDAFLTVRKIPPDPASGSDILYWQTQATNRDQPRACTPQFPNACNPPAAPLILIETDLPRR